MRIATIVLFLLMTHLDSICLADDLSGIPIIDTHIHLYDTNRAQGLPWPPKDDKVLYRPVLPKDFDRVCDENAITAAVIVEASEWLPDNQWVLDLVKHHPDRYIGLVGSLKIGTDDFAKSLKELSKDERYVGIRMRERPTRNFFTEEVWRDLKLLSDMDQTLDVLMFNFSPEECAMMAARLPKLRILMNHLANADVKGQPADPMWIESVKIAAAQKNVYCKISGLFQQSHRQPSPTNVEFYKSTLDVLVREFGEDRLIYGSNWPVTMRGGTYAQYKKVITDYFSPQGRTFVEKLMYKNALKFYGLPELKSNKQDP